MAKRKKKFDWRNGLLLALIGIFGLVMIGKATGVSDWLFRVELDLSDRLASLIETVKQPMGGEEVLIMGGSTSDSWSVGGALTVTGATTLTGTLTANGAIDANGDTRIDKPILGNAVRDFEFYSADENGTSTAADICDYSIWKVATAETTVMGWPDSTSTIADCLASTGQCKSILFWNRSTTSDTTITLTAIDNRYDSSSGGESDFISATTTAATVLDGASIRINICNLDGATTTVEFELPMYDIAE